MATPNKKLAPHKGAMPLSDVLYHMMDDGELLKYREDQARAPKGSPDGGRFVDEGRGRGRLGRGREATALLALNEAKQGGPVDPETFKAQLSAEQRRFIAESEAKIRNSVQTYALVSQGGYRNPDGSWTPERQALHARIIRDYIERGLESATPGEGEAPNAIMLGGRGGSGKTSSTAGLISNPERYLNINSDDVKSLLPEYEGWNAGLLHEESSMITDQIDRIARELGLNVILDSTLKSEGSAVKRMQDYQAAGYDVDGFFVHTTPYISAERAMARAMTSGRFVPPEYVLGSRSNESTFDSIKGGMRSWTLIDNNGSKARVVARGGKR